MGKMKVLRIDWVDASHDDGPLKAQDVVPMVRVTTVGFLVREDKDSVSIAHDHFHDDSTFKHVTTVPKRWITARKELK